jgi:hypothetical protein
MFTVDWSDAALDDLAVFWMAASDPRAVTAAQAEIDRRLASDPTRHGTPQSEGLWRIDVVPLRAFYSVDPAARRVEVYGLRIIL